MAARRVLAAGAAALSAAGAGGYGLVRLGMPDNPLPPAPWADPSVSAPPRREQLAALRSGVEFDLLIIGGGATGTGAALDAATRGLRVALVEGEDFASGTSSRSTKLVHGGVRYLEKAVFQLDYGQLKLVFEALKERRVLLKNAPHLARALPIATPCYDAWEVPYYWAGMKAYDLVAGLGGLTASRFATASQSTRSFPTLAREFGAASGDPEPSRKLLGTIVYEDGQFDDARLATALATTAGAAGATVVNYARVTKLLKDPASGRVIGAKVRDVVDGETRSSGGGEFEVRAKCVLNATGPFSDGVRSMSDATRAPIVTPAGGTHVTLPAYFAPKDQGLIVPKTKDGRVVFMLPWLGGVIAGTTDALAPVTLRPRATAEEVDFILDALAPYLSVPATREDVRSAWSGIRPLAADPSQSGTENVSRDHVVVDEGDGMVTVSGGKWTTYRLMAEHAVDAALKLAGEECRAKAGPCDTDNVGVIGAHGYGRDLPAKLRRDADRGERRKAKPTPDLDDDVWNHLARAYGDRAEVVAGIAAKDPALAARLAPGQPVIAAEVVHAARAEYCETVNDFLARRSRLAFLDVAAARSAAPAVARLLGNERGWGRWRVARETKEANAFLDTFEAR